MRKTRKRVAQGCMAIAAAATFLPWHTIATDGSTETVQGITVNDGQLVLVVSLATTGLIQAGWRPAWIGAGFAGAVMARRMLEGEIDTTSGLWIATAACAAAAVLLVWNLFAGVAAAGDTGEPPGHGLSGPLGRRRR